MAIFIEWRLKKEKQKKQNLYNYWYWKLIATWRAYSPLAHVREKSMTATDIPLKEWRKHMAPKNKLPN